MKKKLLQSAVFGIVVLLTAAIFTLAGCDNGTTSTHTHTYSTEWSYDATQHWHECTSGDGAKSEAADHTYGEWVIDIPATETTDGERHRDCSVCDYVQREAILAEVPGRKFITITGAETLNGREARLVVLAEDSTAENQTRVAYSNTVTVGGGSVTFPLIDYNDDNAWTGTGNHLLVMTVRGEIFDTVYGYTEGAAGATIDDLVPYNIAADTSDIPLSQFGKQPEPRTITISGAAAHNGRDAEIMVLAEDSTVENQTNVASGYARVGDGSVTIPLLDEADNPWTGTGNHLLVLTVEGEHFDTVYGYTAGAPGATIDDLVPYNITDNNVIPLSQFGKQPEPQLITITGLSAELDGDSLDLTIYNAEGDWVVSNYHSVDAVDGEAVFPLYDDNVNPWSGTGDYKLVMEAWDYGTRLYTEYAYTGDGSAYGGNVDDLPTYNIKGGDIIPFSAFGSEPPPKTITITGIPSQYNDSYSAVHLIGDENEVDQASGTITEGTLTVTGFNTVPAGEYGISINLGSDYYYYTAGGEYIEVYANPKYNVTFVDTSIDFDQFVIQP